MFIAIKRHIKQSHHELITHAQIMTVSSLSLSAVKRAINRLLHKKLLFVRSNKGVFKPNTYSLTRSSDRPTTSLSRSSPRPTTSGSHGPTFKNTFLKNTQCVVCFFCKKIIKETLLLTDADGFEYDGCPLCGSDLLVDTSNPSIRIEAKSLLGILRKNAPEDVFIAIDVIEWKLRKGEIVSNFSGLLMHMLRHGIILPDSYIPPSERRKKDARQKELKRNEESRKRKEADEIVEQHEQAEKLYGALSDSEKLALKARAKKELPTVLHTFKSLIKGKMLELLIDSNKQTGITGGSL